MRDFWRSHDGLLGEFATRFAGLVRPLRRPGRRPTASVNLITVHDGFTLADLVSYDGKHNEANGEDNRDGTDDNRSWNCGVEGPATDDAEILACAQQQSRACSRRCCCRSACRCCSAATSSAAPSRATTTPTARTRDQLVRLVRHRRAVDGVHHEADAFGARIRCSGGRYSTGVAG